MTSWLKTFKTVHPTLNLLFGSPSRGKTVNNFRLFPQFELFYEIGTFSFIYFFSLSDFVSKSCGFSDLFGLDRIKVQSISKNVRRNALFCVFTTRYLVVLVNNDLGLGKLEKNHLFPFWCMKVASSFLEDFNFFNEQCLRKSENGLRALIQIFDLEVFSTVVKFVKFLDFFLFFIKIKLLNKTTLERSWWPL